MWMDGVILSFKIEADGSSYTAPQWIMAELTNKGEVSLTCDGFFKFTATPDQWDNLNDCILELRKQFEEVNPDA